MNIVFTKEHECVLCGRKEAIRVSNGSVYVQGFCQECFNDLRETMLVIGPIEAKDAAHKGKP